MVNKWEAHISHKIAKWFLGVCEKSAPFEIKHTRGNLNFRLSEIPDHQRHALEACTTKHGFVYKNPDANMGYLPFDYMMYRNAPAYVIIVYPGVVCAIYIHDILRIKTPSLSKDKALEMCNFMWVTNL